jgi:hypothetical protein
LCAEQEATDQHATVDRRRHGREEHRRVATFAVADRLPPDWQGLIRLPDDQAGLMGFGHQWKSTLP